MIPVYRVVFANNSIISCKVDEKAKLPTDVYYVKDRLGRIVFAYVRAESFINAVRKAKQLVSQIAKGTTR